MRRKVSILLIALLILPSLAFGQPEVEILEEPLVVEEATNQELAFFEQVFHFIKNEHPFPVEDKALIEGALKGMLQSVDEYSDYYGPWEAEEIYKQILGGSTDVQAYIEDGKDGNIVVQDIVNGSRAAKRGLRAGDIILSIDGESIKEVDIGEVMFMLDGPKGSKAILEVQKGKRIMEIEVDRNVIIKNSVKYEILEDVGYIKLYEFIEESAVELKMALKAFDEKDIKKVVLDLRNNPGGLVSEAIDISKFFVPEGPIVHVKEKNKALVTHISTLKEAKYDLAVLVNENTASSSEIVAAAIKEREAGTLIGIKTFGKGTIQSLIPIPDGSIIKMTRAEYLTPSKASINNVGIFPDYEVANTKEEDLQLKKAIEILE